MAIDYFWAITNILAFFDVIVLSFVIFILIKIIRRYKKKYSLNVDTRLLVLGFVIYCIYKITWIWIIYTKQVQTFFSSGFMPNFLLLIGAFLIYSVITKTNTLLGVGMNDSNR